jgi:hypothetical protein
MAEPNKYLVQLRRELTKSQARLARAERERDRALEENAALRKRLSDKNVAPPGKPARKRS